MIQKNFKNQGKWIAVIILVSIVFFSSATVSFGREDEGRAVWIHAQMFSMEQEIVRSELAELLDQYATIGINNIFCFRSMMDQHKKGWDFLRLLLDEAHAKGMKIHPIISPGQVVEIKGEIQEHPEWLIRGLKGELYPNLNIANVEVREYIFKRIAAALVYDIDGIHLDYC